MDTLLHTHYMYVNTYRDYILLYPRPYTSIVIMVVYKVLKKREIESESERAWARESVSARERERERARARER